jgi:cytochrome P450
MNQMLFRPPAPEPGEAPLGLFSLLSVLRNNPLEAWTKAHFEQPLVRGGLPFMPAVVVSEPNAIQHIMLDNAANYRKDELLLRILSPGLGNGLLTVEGEQWRRQRHAVAPMFARKAIHGFAPQMIAAAEALVERWSQLPQGSVVDVAEEVTRVTLDILQSTIFSKGIGRDPEEFREVMRSYFDTIGRIDPLDALGLPAFLPRPTRWRSRSALRFFDRAVNAIIAERRRLLAEAPDDIPRDILTLLLESRDPQSGAGLSEAELRANIVTLIAAGHETTANTLTWSLYLLSQSEAWNARVAAEARRQARNENDDPCRHLAVTRAVIEETMRLYPPIAAISRVAIEPDEIAGEPVPAGTMVIVAPYIVHRHKALWDRPELFDPERFLGASGKPPHRYAYLPFGAGPRICLGAAFALQEACLVLATIVKSFDLRAVAGREVQPLLRITLRPKGGLPHGVAPAQLGAVRTAAGYLPILPPAGTAKAVRPFTMLPSGVDLCLPPRCSILPPGILPNGRGTSNDPCRDGPCTRSATHCAASPCHCNRRRRQPCAADANRNRTRCGCTKNHQHGCVRRSRSVACGWRLRRRYRCRHGTRILRYASCVD